MLNPNPSPSLFFDFEAWRRTLFQSLRSPLPSHGSDSTDGALESVRRDRKGFQQHTGHRAILEGQNRRRDTGLTGHKLVYSEDYLFKQENFCHMSLKVVTQIHTWETNPYITWV